MITVSVFINGTPVATRTAVSTAKGKVTNDTECIYEVDDGNIIYHRHGDGALVLAKKLLDCVKEVKVGVSK